MHELSFVRRALEKIERLNKNEITVRIPENHDVEEFKEILNSFLKNKKIKIKIEKVPIEVKCSECSYEGRVKMPLSMVKMKARCPNCGSLKTKIIRGEDLEVV